MIEQNAELAESKIPLPRFWNPETRAWQSVRSPAANPGEPPQRAPRPPWTLKVESVRDVTPEMRRVRFSGMNLGDYRHVAAADFTISIPTEGEPARRHYTVRAVDAAAGLLDIDFVMHGHGPAVTWAASVQPGASIEVTGPVTRFEIDPAADWYLCAGDESSIPAVFGLIESLPAKASAFAFLEVKGPEGVQALNAAADVELNWLFRGETPGAESRLIQDAILAEQLPQGRGQVFLAGETGRMRELRRALIDNGLDGEQIFAMGYWRPGRLGGDETIRD